LTRRVGDSAQNPSILCFGKNCALAFNVKAGDLASVSPSRRIEMQRSRCKRKPALLVARSDDQLTASKIRSRALLARVRQICPQVPKPYLIRGTNLAFHNFAESFRSAK
jgi:hypothetical protein